jgi:hypothetical protein
MKWNKQVFSILGAALFSISASAQTTVENPFIKNMVDTATAALKEPVVVSRTNGSSFSGFFQSKSDLGFTLYQSVDDGSVEVSFNREEVHLVEFSGDALFQELRDLFDAKDFESVTMIGRLMFQVRLPFLEYMREKDVAYFRILADSFVNMGAPADALGVIRGIKPHISEPEFKWEIEDIELLAYLTLNLSEEAVSLARKKIESATDPSMGTLAWVTLSFHHLNKGRYREALLASVHPILFDREKDSKHRADAYLSAMIASLRLNRPELALKYHAKWQSSGFRFSDKPYQSAWLRLWSAIDWQQIKKDATEFEAFADIESKITPHTDIDRTLVPVLNIPIRSQP